MEIQVVGKRLLLLPQRAVFWRQARMLIVADPHFGKARVFRQSGIPVPGGTTAENFGRLSALMERFCPDELLVLGDLMHGRIDADASLHAAIDTWRKRWRDVRLCLVTGNHDLKAGEPPAPFRLDRIGAQHDAFPFFFTHQHEPKPVLTRYTIAGHVHPAVRVGGTGRQRETLPCFHFGKNSALLPAFGSFTGNHVIHPARGDRVYVIAGDEVINMSPG